MISFSLLVRIYNNFVVSKLYSRWHSVLAYTYVVMTNIRAQNAKNQNLLTFSKFYEYLTRRRKIGRQDFLERTTKTWQANKKSDETKQKLSSVLFNIAVNEALSVVSPLVISAFLADGLASLLSCALPDSGHPSFTTWFYTPEMTAKWIYIFSTIINECSFLSSSFLSETFAVLPKHCTDFNGHVCPLPGHDFWSNFVLEKRHQLIKMLFYAENEPLAQTCPFEILCWSVMWKE